MQKLCDERILPISAVDYALRVKDEVTALKQRYEEDFFINNISFNFIEEYTGVIDQLQAFFIRSITVKIEIILSLQKISFVRQLNFMRKSMKKMQN